ncbi:TetR/AcrR family transcriptional regulator [Flavivirga eckloniae]|uniref:TetR/AcrR family transcriptional regulator n=1 Tax=Flavivirga eckloniae TaxID=1803846 RepID=A0A2K9PPH3_9FLAO|nr:TetR/AcrR family transcriptional regulator [Flavivirga eckloniae]AUP78467.1 TetR/AcrR family transcriptional regulator [Flavivirga eckloniae]
MKKLGVKERIIETASDLFYHNGFNQTGINQIIAEAGVAKASMYQHFKSKEDIAVAYLVKRHALWMEQLLNFLSTKNTPKDKVIGLFDFLTDWLCEVDFRGCGWQNIITDLPNDHDKIRNQAINHKNEVRSHIHTILKDEYSEEQSKELGDQILVLIEGAIILSQIQKNKWPVLTAKNAAICLLK